MTAGKINVYNCCHGHRTVTIDTDDAVTPFMIGCRSPGCSAMAQSSFYRVDQKQRPDFEFTMDGPSPTPARSLTAADVVALTGGRITPRQEPPPSTGSLKLRRVKPETLERFGYPTLRGPRP